VILLDTSVLISALTGRREGAALLERVIEEGDPLAVSCLVIFEWLRGPRNRTEIIAQEALCPIASALNFGPPEAEIAAQLYRSVSRPRGREIDIGIAATAIRYQAHLWTLNPRDFSDIPGLSLWRAR
jgi:predicted nucleic acid-binding protein